MFGRNEIRQKQSKQDRYSRVMFHVNIIQSFNNYLVFTRLTAIELRDWIW